MNLKSLHFDLDFIMNSLAVIKSAFVETADLAQCLELCKYLVL